ncbi:hypothetical protein FKM82_027153 [Ascaphus truei]
MNDEHTTNWLHVGSHAAVALCTPLLHTCVRPPTPSLSHRGSDAPLSLQPYSTPPFFPSATHTPCVVPSQSHSPCVCPPQSHTPCVVPSLTHLNGQSLKHC